MSSSALCIGRPETAAAALAAALGAPLVAPPALPAPSDATTLGWSWASAVEAWADELATGDELAEAVLCTWPHQPPRRQVVEFSPTAWSVAVEQELALWSRALVAVCSRCRAGGSVVVVVDRPSPLDADGRVAALAVAEGLTALARSAALVHGARQVRVNTVASALSTSPSDLLGLPPALPTFPGSAEVEVAGAVRLLWSADAAGVTGTLVRADGGRSW